MTRRRAAILLALLCLLGLALRVGVILKTRSYANNPGPAEHASIARALLNGEGFSFGEFGHFGPTSIQSPTYPYFLAGVFRIFGVETPASFLVAMLVNAAVGTLVIWLTYRLARALGAARAAAILAAAACAVWPTQIYASNFAQAITWIIAAVVAVMILFTRATRTGRPAPWIAFSLVGTAAALTEPVLLPVMALSGVVILFWRSLPFTIRLRNAVLLLFAVIVVIGPWTYRNYRVHHAFVPIKATFWVNVWKGANDHATGTDRPAIDPARQAELDAKLLALDDLHLRREGADDIRQYDLLDPADQARLEGKTEVQREKIFKELATSWIKAHPRRYADLSLIRLGKTLWVDWDNPKSHNLAYIGSRAAIVLMTLIGLPIALRRRWPLFFPLMLVGLCLLTYTLTLTAARFSMPFEPLQLCLGAGALAWLLRRLRGLPETSANAH